MIWLRVLPLLFLTSIWVWAVGAMEAATQSTTPEPLPLGTRRQLLFDQMFLEESRGVTLRVNRPVQESEPVLVADKPWEHQTGAYHTVLLDNGKFRMWYDATTLDQNGREARRLLCYAESKDGIRWEKPELGLISFDGSRANNIVAPPRPGASQQGATVFRDDRAPPSERYKLWTKYQPRNDPEGPDTARRGLWAMVSPDGLRWKMIDRGYPLSKGNAADSQNVAFWDQDLGKYVAFVRMKKLASETRQRQCWVGLMTSDDFRHWTHAKKIFRADEQIPVPEEGRDLPPLVDLYTPVGMKVPGVPGAYILLPTPYYHWRKGGFPSNIDVALATSRDLVSWWQPADPEPFLRLGPDGSATSGMIFSNPWLIPNGDEIWIYYAGLGFDHRGGVRNRLNTGIFRARIRRDGFVSVDAGYKGGEFITPLVTFGGKRLLLNLDGSAGGWLQVEVLSHEGTPIPGYQLQRCDTMRGNALDKVVTWQGKADVSGIAGQPVRLRFVMRSMKLYAFQFAE